VGPFLVGILSLGQLGGLTSRAEIAALSFNFGLNCALLSLCTLQNVYIENTGEIKIFTQSFGSRKFLLTQSVPKLRRYRSSTRSWENLLVWPAEK
jgi:hypothetical protein